MEKERLKKLREKYKSNAWKKNENEVLESIAIDLLEGRRHLRTSKQVRESVKRVKLEGTKAKIRNLVDSLKLGKITIETVYNYRTLVRKLWKDRNK